MINIEIDKSIRVIRYFHSSTISCDDIMDAYQRLIQIDEFVNQGYDLMTDYRCANFFLGVEDIDRIAKFFLSINDVLKNKSNAILSSTPYSTAIFLLILSRIESESNYDIKLFATENAALEWIKIKRTVVVMS